MQSVMKILRVQTSLFTEEELTSLQVDSHANHTHPQESDLEKKMTDTSGLKCLEQFEKFNRCTSWAKMFAASLIGMEGWYSTKCRLIWKLKATKCSRFYFQLAPSMLRTDETEFGLLLKTPAAMDAYSEKLSKKEQKFGNSGTLAQEVATGFIYQRGLLPTPTAMVGDTYADRSKNAHLRHTPNIATLAVKGMLPTPMASDCGDKVTGLENQDSLVKIAREATGKTSQLSPQFIMEMMGFPNDWTLLPFLSGETSPSKQEATQ